MEFLKHAVGRRNEIKEFVLKKWDSEDLFCIFAFNNASNILRGLRSRLNNLFLNKSVNHD